MKPSILFIFEAFYKDFEVVVVISAYLITSVYDFVFTWRQCQLRLGYIISILVFIRDLCACQSGLGIELSWLVFRISNCYWTFVLLSHFIKIIGFRLTCLCGITRVSSHPFLSRNTKPPLFDIPFICWFELCFYSIMSISAATLNMFTFYSWIVNMYHFLWERSLLNWLGSILPSDRCLLELDYVSSISLFD